VITISCTLFMDGRIESLGFYKYSVIVSDECLPSFPKS
jgi:hypothetical protein